MCHSLSGLRFVRKVVIALIILRPRASLPCSTRDVCAAADESTAALYFKIPLSEGKFDNVRTASDKEQARADDAARALLILCVPHHRTTAHSPSLLLVELECFEFVNPLFLSIPHSFVEISSPGCSAGSALLNQLVELWSGRRTMMFHPPRTQQ